MKKLSILRHGKSSWENTALDDIDRPLIEKGITRTKKVCKYMLSNQLIPQCVISSPAERANKTAHIVIEELKLSLFPQIENKFYLGDVYSMLDILAEVDTGVDHLLIVGHNPSLTNLINKMAKSFTMEWLPTSGLVTLEFNIDKWEYIIEAQGNCLHNVSPKRLK